MNNKFIIMTLLIVTFLISCNTNENNPIIPEKELFLKDVKYSDDSRNIMDIKLPAKRTNSTPFVVLIHGGSWNSGDKSYFTDLQNSLFEKGIASVSINYRYISQTIHNNEIMSDIDKAIDYCIEKSELWKIRKDKYIIAGHSAGGHLALMYGYKFDIKKRIGAIIDISGPTNFFEDAILIKARNMWLLNNIELLADAKYIQGQQIPENFKLVSPYWNVRNVPTLIIHGTKDEIVSYSQAQQLDSILRHKSYTYNFLSIQNGNHVLDNISENQNKQIEYEMVNWIEIYGK